MILFLDIDGVLHPLPDPGQSGAEQFTRLDLLEEVLRQLPHVDVVISSSWRELHPLDDIRTYFSPDVQARIVDVTPMRVAAAKCRLKCASSCAIPSAWPGCAAGGRRVHRGWPSTMSPTSGRPTARTSC